MTRELAIELRHAGLSIREIAAQLEQPRATVGGWVVGIEPMDYSTPDDDAPTDPRLELLTRRCSSCGVAKTWGEFWAAAKWPDGTMRRPQAHCRDCVKARRRDRRRRNPEWARAQNQREWQRIKADPDKLAKRRELTRENGRVHRLRQQESA